MRRPSRAPTFIVPTAVAVGVLLGRAPRAMADLIISPQETAAYKARLASEAAAAAAAKTAAAKASAEASAAALAAAQRAAAVYQAQVIAVCGLVIVAIAVVALLILRRSRAASRVDRDESS